jgi:hypothetical protein
MRLAYPVQERQSPKQPPDSPMNDYGQKYKGLEKGGVFRLASGEEVAGELRLKGADSSLRLYSDVRFDARASREITGRLFDGTLVALINCVFLDGSGISSEAGIEFSRATIFPQCVVIGPGSLDLNTKLIHSIYFSIDDVYSIFHDFSAFGAITQNTRSLLGEALLKEPLRKQAEIGESPRVYYYTDKSEIISVETIMGLVSVNHMPSPGMPGPKGIELRNRIEISIQPNEGVPLASIIQNLTDLVQFFGITAGRPQNVTYITVLPACKTSEQLEVHLSFPPYRNQPYFEPSPPVHIDISVSPITQPEQFKAVLKAWLERHKVWRNARDRFMASFSLQNTYSIDRLIAAANMFDILPSSACPNEEVIDDAIWAATKRARADFQALPASPDRDSVLGALGRVGKQSLKKKIRARASIISSQLDDDFPDLKLVVDHAVNCRNHYVHGSMLRIDWTKNDFKNFFVDALEFIFATSDLIESGWSIREWASRGSAMSHPFGRFRVTYKDRLAALKELLEASR